MSEPSPLSDADKIRLKRLARLGGSQSASPVPQSQGQAQAQASGSGTSGGSGGASGAASPSAPPVPVVKPAAPKPTPRPAPPPPSASPAPAPKQARTTPQTQTQTGKFTESFEEWEGKMVERVMGVTLDVEQARKSNWRLVYLKDVALDLLSEDPSLPTPPPLQASYADRLLLSRLSLPSSAHAGESDDPEAVQVFASLPHGESPFEYLAGCWKRERRERGAIGGKKDSDPAAFAQRLAALDHIKSLLVSYMGFTLMDSSMFDQEHLASSNKPLGSLELSPLLLPSLPKPATLPIDFSDAPSLLADLAARFVPSSANDHEGGMDQILLPLFKQWNAWLLANKVDIGSTGPSAVGQGMLQGTSWREVMNAFENVAQIKALAAFLTEMEGFDPTREGGAVVKAEHLEYRALLGPITRLGAYPDAAPSLAQAYFPNPSDTPRGNIDSATASLRGVVRGVQLSLFRLHDALIRSSPSARSNVLSYLARTAALNAKRAAMRVDPRTVSTESFVGNLHAVLLRLCEPFMGGGMGKIDKIDPLYYRNPGALIDVKEETKINANKEESDAFFAAGGAEAPPPNFISHTFFLCAQYLHIGPMHAIKEHKGIGQQISHMVRTLKDMEAELAGVSGPERERAQVAVDRYKKKLEHYRSYLLAYEVQLLDPEYLAQCSAFANLMMAWMVRLVDPKGKHPQERISLPLPDETPDNFRFLPEFLIEDITEFLSFASKYAPQVLEQSPQDELMTFMLVFLSTPYMKNPYLKGQFVEIMYYLSRPTYTNPRGCLGDTINFHTLALQNLMPCLVHAYIEIEITGSHTQFYDKFNIRYYITQLFKMVWSNPTHREALKRESQNNFDRYVRFVNLLMNDTTYLLDDALLHLGKIADLQRLQDDTAAWEALTPEERQEKEKLLRQYEGNVRSDLDLGHESLRLLKLFAGETTAPFLTPEIVDRLAAMLDQNLLLLAGPRCQDLKVKDAERLKFRPKELLNDVLEIFMQLGPHVEFQSAVAKDGRSYSTDLFARATRIARKTAIKTDDELKVLEDMVVKVEAIKAAEEEDEAMGDVPDEFLDPLTYDLMRDPVLLPSSRTIVDRSTIKQHYLSDPTDPFNRQPLDMADVVDAVELREQIAQWKEDRRRRKAEQAAAAVGGEGEKMQIDE